MSHEVSTFAAGHLEPDMARQGSRHASDPLCNAVFLDPEL